MNEELQLGELITVVISNTNLLEAGG